MSKTVPVLALLVLSLLSCRSEQDIPFSDFELKDKNSLGEYILPEYRDELLKSLDTSHFYRLKLNIDQKRKKAFGSVRMTWHNSSGFELNELRFRLLMNSDDLAPMSIQSVQSGGSPLKFTLSGDNTVLYIETGVPIVENQSAEVAIQYSIDFSEPPAYYFDFARISDRGFSIPHFYPVAARIEDGKWEEEPLHKGGDLLSADSSWFLVDVEYDRDLTVVSSGMELDSRQSNGRKITTFAAGPVRDVFMYGARDIASVTRRIRGTAVRSYGAEDLEGSMIRAAEIAAAAVNLFNGEFGAYPFGELKIGAMPMSALGIEYPGFFAIKDTLYEEPVSFLFEPTIVHEAAHQWFYSLIGSNQIREPWIDEGLAQYATWYYFSVKYGERGASGFYNSFVERWERIEKRELPVNRDVSFYQDREYSAIIYGRAPLLMMDIRDFMGEENFHAFLRSLVSSYSYGHIDGEAFMERLREAAGPAVDEITGGYFD